MPGRNEEKKQLEQIYEIKENTLMVLYGRKDMGKKAMLMEFVQDKKHFYYCAGQASQLEQKIMMGREIAEKFNTEITETAYENFFSRMGSHDGSKLVLIIDHFQNIAKKDPEFMENVILLREGKLSRGSVMIILCSSSIGWVENDMAECMGAQINKIQYMHKIPEINFLEMVRSFPNYSVRDCVEVYGVLGGVPGYIRRWDKERDLKYNICRHILSEDGLMYNEAEKFIGSELRELSVYNTILAAIASGRRKLNDLYLYTGFSRAKISVYIKNLMAFEVVEKVCSFETGGWDNAQKGIYRISNTFVDFWFRFVYPQRSDLNMLTPEKFYEKHVESFLGEYLNYYFIKVCREYLELMGAVNQLPLRIYKMGTWIGKKGNVDIIVQNKIRENLVGMCSWSEDEFSIQMYEKLLECMEMAKIKASYIYLFSAEKFERKLTDAAEKNKKLILVDMNRL